MTESSVDAADFLIAKTILGLQTDDLLLLLWQSSDQTQKRLVDFVDFQCSVAADPEQPLGEMSLRFGNRPGHEFHGCVRHRVTGGVRIHGEGRGGCAGDAPTRRFVKKSDLALRPHHARIAHVVVHAAFFVVKRHYEIT